ncbi:MAG: hypothetical protein OEL20_04935 [Sulfuritalea sp.]|nr:hypothetical protein [Sulfuritalea sp.]
MFEHVVFLLLTGKFICRVTQPAAFDFLSDEDHFRHVEGYLAQIGRRLTRTTHESGYYLSFARIGDSERKVIKAAYQEIKTSLRPIVLFFQAVMRTTGREDLLMPGGLLEKSALMAQIDLDGWLRGELQSVAAYFRPHGGDGSHRAMLDRIIREMVDADYLVLSNAERGLYRVTAKIEYLTSIIQFITDTEDALKNDPDDDPLPESLTLL